MSDKQAPLSFPIGTVKGLTVTMAVSRKSRMTLIKEACGDGEHIALSTAEGAKWKDRPDVSGDDLTAHFKEMVRRYPSHIQTFLWELFPKYKGIPVSEFGFQTGSNDAISAARTDIHAHIIVALATTWKSDIVPRFVTPVEPVPEEKREPR